MLALAALLLACSPPVLPGAEGVPQAPADTDAPVDSATPPDAVGGSEDQGAAYWLFGLDAIHAVDLELSDKAVAALSAEPYEYVEAAVTIDGERLDPVAVRIKGKLGSYRSLSGKAAFRVDLNRLVEGQSYHGLKALTLNNMVNDYSFVHEVVSYSLYPLVGVPAPRTGYTWLTVNGTDFGLYLNVETPDDVWLERVYEHPDGNLYEADYVLYDDGSYTLIDFNSSTQDLLSLDEGQDCGHEDVHRVTAAVEATWGTDDFYDAVGEALDWPAFFRYWATELWLGQWDGYNYNTNNYKVYFNPATDRAELLPWGHDWTFFDWRTWTSPYSVLGYGCLQHDACAADFAQALEEACATFDEADVAGTIETARALIGDAIAADPRKEVSAETATCYQDVVSAWASWRSGYLRGVFGIPGLSVGTVHQGAVALVSSSDELDLSGEIVAALNLGGGALAVDGITFASANPTGQAYQSNLPTFDDDDSTLNGLESLAYSCSYNASAPMTVSVPVTAGERYLVQALFFETYYQTQGYRTIDVTLEDEPVASGLDTSANSRSYAILLSAAVEAGDESLDLVLTGVSADATPLVNALVVTAAP